MALDQLRNVNFGKSLANATGSTGVGYTLLDVSGSLTVARTTAGVYQLTSGSGLYAAYISFPDEFRGQVLWDTGAAFSSINYATEDYNVESNNPRVNDIYTQLNIVSGTIGVISGNIDFIRDMTDGRWKIDTTLNQMIFYRSDNITEVARFDLTDSAGSPTSDSPYERTRV